MGTEPAELLREHGIQVTAQRLAVLRVVTEAPHSTADRVAEAARAEIGAISLQSVYDALGVLVAEGLVRRIQPAGSAALFEARVGDNHHHLICRVCGRIVDVDCAAGAAPCLTASDDQGYEIDEAEVAYWGRCPDCQARAGAPPGADVPAPRRRSRTANGLAAELSTAQAADPRTAAASKASTAQAAERKTAQPADPRTAAAPKASTAQAAERKTAQAADPRTAPAPEASTAQAAERKTAQAPDPNTAQATTRAADPAPAQAHEPLAAQPPPPSTAHELEDRRPH